ncbi:MAG: hypothetical protein KBT87_14645 [Gammaproteobacteria bacterium]|nr:hypothetical protein [Gammaproteobacteria bacterium]
MIYLLGIPAHLIAPACIFLALVVLAKRIPRKIYRYMTLSLLGVPVLASILLCLVGLFLISTEQRLEYRGQTYAVVNLKGSATTKQICSIERRYGLFGFEYGENLYTNDDEGCPYLVIMDGDLVGTFSESRKDIILFRLSSPSK